MMATTSRSSHDRATIRGSRRPVRVLHVAEYIKGGIATYLDAVLAYRAENSGAGAVALLVPEAEVDQVTPPPGVLVETYPYRGRGPLSLLRLIWRISKAIRTIRPDIVHFHSSFPGFAGRLPMLFRSRRPICVYCAHGWSFEIEMAPWRQRVFARVERALSRATDAVVNISMSDHRAALDSGLDEDRCVYIPNGVDFPDSESGAGLTAMDEDVINLLFVGRFDRQKGIDILMNAMAQLIDEPLRLYVVGEAVLGGVEVVPLQNVEFLGWRSRDTLQGLFASADAVVMPSRWEGFGMVAIEAMCCGTAVVASDRGALPELVQDGRTGLIFDLEDTEAFSDLLRSLDKSRLQTMGEKGRVRYRSFYTASAMNERLEVLYDVLADGGSARDAHAAIGEIETDAGAGSDDAQEAHTGNRGAGHRGAAAQ